MAISIIAAVLAAWAVLTLLGGELQRQRQHADLTKRATDERARSDAAKAVNPTSPRGRGT